MSRRFLDVVRIFRRRNISGELNETGKSSNSGWRIFAGVLSGCLVSSGCVLYFLEESVSARELEYNIPKYPWSFEKPFKSFDHAALRRGWQVYKELCSACHSLQYLRFMDLVNVTHTEEEVKNICSEYEIEDGPDKEGNNFMRPAKLVDKIPPPFPNEQAARVANGGMYPPDLTYLVPGRISNKNYVFSVLTGYYWDKPAGVTVIDGKYFNLYYANGGVISMAEPLYNGAVEYEDGTPATVSQMAKDVIEFLCWTSSQEHDDRKLSCMKGLGILAMLLVAFGCLHRRQWSFIRSRQICLVPKKKT